VKGEIVVLGRLVMDRGEQRSITFNKGPVAEFNLRFDELLSDLSK
jgi:hypothetical protein